MWKASLFKTINILKSHDWKNKGWFEVRFFTGPFNRPQEALVSEALLYRAVGIAVAVLGNA